MKKGKIFLFFSSILASSIIFSGTVAMFNSDKVFFTEKNLSHKQSFNSAVNEENLDANSISFEQDTYQTNTTTPYGILKIDSTSKTLYSISFFGNIGWKYSLSQSKFIKRINSNPSITSVYAYYVSDIDRIVVYGIANSKSFLFQLNAIDGSEYYVNNEEQNVVGSSLIQDFDTSMISDLDAISIMADNTIVLLPKEIPSSKKIQTYKINLKSYIASPLNIDLSTFDGKGTETTETQNEDTKKNYSYKNILGYFEAFDKNYLILKAVEGETQLKDGKRKVGILVIGMDDSLKYNSESTFYSFSTTNETTNDSVFNKSYYGYVNVRTLDSETLYFVMKEMPQYQSLSSSNVAIIKFSKDKKSIQINSVNRQLKDSDLSQKGIISDIYYEKNNVYTLVRNSDTSDQKSYGFFNVTNGSSITNLNYPIKIDDSTSSATSYCLSIRVIPGYDYGVGKTNMPFVYSYVGVDGSSNFVSSKVGSLRINSNSTASTSSSASYTVEVKDEYSPTQISSYQNLNQKYSHYLPQDITLEILSEYIYAHKPSQTTKLFDSKLTLDNHGYLNPDNSKGTLNGLVYLNLTKWWISDPKTTNISATNNIEKIPITINISGLATNAGLQFSLVLNANVNSNKYAKILEYQKTKYPSQITKQDILNYFIEKGTNLNITEDNIKFVREGNVYDSKTSVSTKEIVENNDNSENIVLIVTTNDDDGTIKIDYDLEKISSPSALNKTGSGSFTNFLQLNTWQKLSWNETKLINLKKSKMIFQITKEDLIGCLNLSSSYKKDESYWKWTWTNDETTNKSQYIQDNINGDLNLTLEYDRDKGQTPTNVSQDYTKITISKNDKGAGFIPLITSLGTTNSKSVIYSEEKATQLGSAFSFVEAEKNAREIFKQSITFYNNWTTIDSLSFVNPKIINNELMFTPEFNTEKIVTNFKDYNGNNLILDKDWISAISNKSNVFKFTNDFSFKFNQIKFEWNYNIPTIDNQFNINDIIIGDSSKLNSSDLKYFSNLTASTFTNLYKDSNNNYLSFQDKFDLLKIDKNLSESNINYFVIKNIQLVPNDENGTVLVQYEINYPNIVSNSPDGQRVFPSITLTGFKTNASQLHQYIILILIIAIIIVLIGLSFGVYILVDKRKNAIIKQEYRKKQNYKKVSLIEQQKYKNYDFMYKEQKIRNTINNHTLKSVKDKDYQKSVKNYKENLKNFKKDKK